MKLLEVASTNKKIIKCITAFTIILLFNTCKVEKNDYQILKNSKPDTSIHQNNYGSIKSSTKMQKSDRDGLLFDQYIANDFQLPKNHKDSAAIVDYFVKTSFAQLGRTEFRQWDIVVIRGVVFQVNVAKNNDDSRLRLWGNQSKIELVGMIFVLLGFYFL